MTWNRPATMSRCSFGIKKPLPQEKPPVGPGPQQYNINNMCTRYGPQKAPSYSLGRKLSRQSDNGIPGPGAYFPFEMKRKFRSTTPGFSLIGRTILPMNSCSPGPASYTLPSVIGTGSGPCIKGRKTLVPEILNENPGPASYGLPDISIYKWKTPKFSMSGRKMDPFSNPAMSDTPAPWAYSQDYKPAKAKSGCSFGRRHSNKCTTLVLPDDKT
ncbi:ciliary microtubule associated protein 1B [Anabrus simplex]|uniref:ciliary microtubule associated protein 1B n=1 Tax=Anabrus simplex TaxID=316456 RepID=UPI0035A32013